VRTARATIGLGVALFLALVSPLLFEWFETASASSRLSYALLVPALAWVLARRARGGSADAGPTVRDRSVAAGLAGLAGLTLLAGTLSSVFTLSLLACPLAVLAFAAHRSGRAGLRRLAPALAFLFLMVPPPSPLLDRLNPTLVEASGRAATFLLRPFDAEVSWIGATLGFRGWQLIVAEACSGSGTFLMLGCLCVFLAGLFRLRALGALALILSALPVTLAINAARIASSALVIDRFGAAAGQGLAHELLGEGVVVLGVALVVLCVERAARSRVRMA
jgi:exosortase